MFNSKPKKRKRVKYTKVFHGNQYVSSFKTGEGRWRRAWRMTKLYVTSAVLLVLIGAGLLVLATPTDADTETIVTTVRVQEVTEDKIVAMQNEILEELAFCETGSIKDQDGAIIYDTNGRMSLGRYMWQRESVIHYFKSLYGKDITKAEAIAVAIDPDRASQLTKDVLFQTEKGWANWYNCNKKIGLQMKVDFLKKVID